MKIEIVLRSWRIFVALAFAWNCAYGITKDDCPNTIPKDSYTGVYGHKCYRFEMDVEKKYTDAQAYCRRRGGNLAMIKTADTNYFLLKLLASSGFYENAWIGLDDRDVENDFKWIDGTPLEYANWADEEEGPRSGLVQHKFEDCVVIDVESNGKWRDYRCKDYWFIQGERKPFICEFKVEVVDNEITTLAPSGNTGGYDTMSVNNERISPSTTQMPSTTTKGCEELTCDLDCGMGGYDTDEKTGCYLCECYGS